MFLLLQWFSMCKTGFEYNALARIYVPKSHPAHSAEMAEWRFQSPHMALDTAQHPSWTLHSKYRFLGSDVEGTQMCNE